IRDALRTASIPYVLVGAFLLVANMALRVVKWRYMLHIVKDDSSWWESSSSMLLGITLGSFTPGQLGELGGRSMRVDHPKSSHVVGLTLVDRTQVFLVIAAAGIFAYAFFLFTDALAAGFFGILAAGVCLYLYVRLDLVKKVTDRIHWRVFRHAWVDEMIDTFTFIGPDHVFPTLYYSIAYYAVLTLQMYFLVNAFVPLSIWNVFLGFSAMMFFKSLVNISISDIGVREASTVYFFSLLGVPDAAALSASGLMFTVNVIIPSIVGVFFLPRLNRAAAKGATSIFARKDGT
ncbi:MAG TPA: lysylphosphatidylglycerol synthase transmembrane domain-containing protein, partial [Bacteroidota bacterium]|nr:lysylphosphatidylglycerol synthase transmembrane domain-containing protein [Bacteroidota bacterium]